MTELVPAAAMAAFALASGYATLTVHHKEKAIESVEEVTVDELTPGDQVKLQGRVEAEETVTSPITGEQAVVVEWEVNGEENGSDGNEDETRLASGQRSGTFSLTDGTGSVPIEPPYGTNLSVSDENTYVDRRHDPTLETLEAVDESVRQGDDRGNNTMMVSQARQYDEMKFRHEILKPGDDLTVVGTAQQSEDGIVVGGGEEFVLSDLAADELAAEFTKKKVLLGAVTVGLVGAVIYLLLLA
jgi:hypothetical protein